MDILAIARNNGFENVLILQGGGSLGVFGCGVFKALAEIRVEILAGTSTGRINAAIIAGSKDNRPELALEQFWLELAENSVDLAPPPPLLRLSIPPPTPTDNELKSYYSRYHQQAGIKNLIKEGESKTKQSLRKIGL